MTAPPSPSPKQSTPLSTIRDAVGPAVRWRVVAVGATRALGVLRTLLLAWLVVPRSLRA
jgi:hypothetical protein